MFFGDEKNNMQDSDFNVNDEETVTWEDVLNADNDDDLVSMDDAPAQQAAPQQAAAPSIDSDIDSDDLDGDVSDEELARILNSGDFDDDDNGSDEDDIFGASSDSPDGNIDMGGTKPSAQMSMDALDEDVVVPGLSFASGDEDNDDSFVGYNDGGMQQEAPQRKTYNIPKQNMSKKVEKKGSSKLVPIMLLILIAFLGTYCYFTMFSGSASKSKDLGLKKEPIQKEEFSQSQDAEIPVLNEDEASQIAAEEQEPQEKTEIVEVQQTGRPNPFAPLKKYVAVSIPQTVVDYNSNLLPEPPARYGETDERVEKLISIAVSGIMYDQRKPSAIITFDNNDYFVQVGDLLDDYRVVEIARNYVVIALGKNTFRANIGEEFKVNEFYGNAKYFGIGRQYHSVQENRDEGRAQERYVSTDDVEINATKN